METAIASGRDNINFPEIESIKAYLRVCCPLTLMPLVEVIPAYSLIL